MEWYTKQPIVTLLVLSGSMNLATGADNSSPQELEQIIISTPLMHSQDNTSLPVSVLSGDELRMKAANSIGETLKNEPGIHSQSFGPGVGQPVIRGQSGSRTQVLQNGIGSLDASSLSPDHANSTEALWAERIEVLRGPASLLYGSGAIGGIVNVIDNRIPDHIPETLIEGAVEQRYNTVNEGKNSAFKLDVGKDMLAIHLDGFFRESIDMQIPGLALNQKAGADGFNSKGRLLNTDARTYSGTAGFSIIGQHGFIGLSANYLDNNYGIPLQEADESIRIDLQQARYDLKGELKDPFAFAESLRVRLGYNDYQHTELENGATGTVYKNEGFEGRLELVQKPWAVFDHGVIGVQTKNSEFSGVGEEAIIPRSDIDSFGFFTVQDIHTDAVTYEVGFRVEQQFIQADGMKEVSHTPVSASVSALWSLTDYESVSLSFTRSQRAPDVQELFSDGPHLATSSFDRGDADLKEETSHNLELGFHIDREWLTAELNFYQNWVQDYIAQINSGSFFDRDNEIFVNSSCTSCLPVFVAQQRNAEFQGFEAQLTFHLLETAYGQLNTQFFGDYVRGRFTDGLDIPRLPPLRYGTQLTWNHSDWSANIRLTRAERQNRPGDNETATDGYWLLNTSAHYKLGLGNKTDMFFFVKGNNLLDQEIRSSVSFLRNIAPEGARGLELGLRVTF